MKRKIIFYFALIVYSVACTTTKIDSLNSFRDVPLKEAEFLPTQEQLAGKKENLVINNIKNTSDLSNKSKSGEAVTSQLYKYLSEANVEIVNRNAAKKFQDEIGLALESGSAYEGPQVANYVIDGQVDSVNFTVNYNPEYEAVSIITGDKYIVEASCTYIGAMQGRIGLYKIPESKLIKNININDQESYSRSPSVGGSTTTQIASLFLTGKQPHQCPIDKSLISQLINNAAKESIRKTRIFLLNFFAPKGYLSEMLENDGQYIARITAGSNSGFQEGQEVQIFSIIEKKNNLTGKVSREEREIGKGVVSNKVGSDYAYIILEDENLINKVRLGNFVKTKHEKALFEKITDFSF